MNTEGFVTWALDPARSLEERYTIELLVEQGVTSWKAARKVYEFPSLEEIAARNRERTLNPAYEPTYAETDLRKAVEYLARATTWWFHSERPVRSLEPLRFLDKLESIALRKSELSDLSPLAELPALHQLSLGSIGYTFGNPVCEDFRPLARCVALRELNLGFNVHWPDLTGLDTLPHLETLSLSGNLLAMPRGVVFPQVRRATLYCIPLAARDLGDLPELPLCEFLTLFGAERLDGIEKMPHLRNLTLLGPFRSFEPVAALQNLTCLTARPVAHDDAPKLPRDIRPLVRLPQLRYFRIGPQHSLFPDMPRDFEPMAEAPALRELVVENCPPVAMEVAAIQAGLPSWDDVFWRPEPRPLGPLQIISAPPAQCGGRNEEQRDSAETGLIDEGLRECEGRWVEAYAHRCISEKIGHSDWGAAKANGRFRSLSLTIESFDVVEQLPEIVEAAREVLARLRPDYEALFGIHLRVPKPTLTPAQRAVEEKLMQQQDDEEFEQRQRDHAEYLERLHELELKKQQGLEIDPEDFSPSEAGAPVKVPAGDEIDEPADFEIDLDDDDDEGGVAVETDEDPDVDWLTEGEHPLASNYLCAGKITRDEMWIYSHLTGIGCHLMRRPPDREIAAEKSTV